MADIQTSATGGDVAEKTSIQSRRVSTVTESLPVEDVAEQFSAHEEEEFGDDPLHCEDPIMHISGTGHWFLEGWIGDHSVEFLVDSGSSVTAISDVLYGNLLQAGAPVGALQVTARTLRSANGTGIEVLGCSRCSVSFLGLRTEFPIIICSLAAGTDAIIGTDVLGSVLPHTLDIKNGLLFTRAKTAFATHSGLFQFRVMPFGLCNAPATFERLMDRVLQGLRWSRCLVYLDDIISFGGTFGTALSNLTLIFERLRLYGLQLKSSKCHLFRESVPFLGHIVGRRGLECDPKKIEDVKSWPVPDCLKSVRQFLGFVGYYLRFILAFPTETGQYILDTDASNFGLGGVLSQMQDDRELVVAYCSRALRPSQRRYCTTKREMLAVAAMYLQFRSYLRGARFTLRTDHMSLVWLHRFKDTEGMLSRWLHYLQQFQFSIIHRPGKDHGNADGLSRAPSSPCRQCTRPDCPPATLILHDSDQPFDSVSTCSSEDADLVPVQSGEDWIARLDDDLSRPVGTSGDSFRISALQKEDPVCVTLHDWVLAEEFPAWAEVKSMLPELRSLWHHRNNLSVDDNGTLWRKRSSQSAQLQLLVPKDGREQLFLYYQVTARLPWGPETSTATPHRGLLNDILIDLRGAASHDRLKANTWLGAGGIRVHDTRHARH